MITQEECIEAVSRPGKFEGERPYVPYYWEAYGNGFADSETEEYVEFYPNSADCALFPELRGRSVVRLAEREDGFVVEVMVLKYNALDTTLNKEQRSNYIKFAKDCYEQEGLVEFDDQPAVSWSPGGDGGAYVAAWIWVSDTDVVEVKP